MLLLVALEERLAHAIYGMKGNETIKPLHASLDTFANYAEVYTIKLPAPLKRILMPKWYNMVCHTGEPTIRACGCCYCEYHPYSVFQSHNEPWNPGNHTIYHSLP